MTKRDGLLALLVAGATLGPWQTANRLSRVIVVIGACPDLWPARGALVGGIMALHYEGSTAVRALRGTLTAPYEESITAQSWRPPTIGKAMQSTRRPGN
jgi:hypothetical protein